MKYKSIFIFVFIILVFLIFIKNINKTQNEGFILSEVVSKINSQGMEDVPYISPDGNKLYFHYTPFKFSDLHKGKKTVIGPLRIDTTIEDFNRQYFVGYVSIKENDVWQEPRPIKFQDNSYAWGSVDITNDGNYMYTIAKGKSGKKSDRMDIVFHTLKDGIWRNPTYINVINSEYTEDDPDIARDNSYLVWDSNRPDGLGERDIWASEKQPNGEWSIPKNLGELVNTEYNEQYPFLNSDGTKLYFNRAIPSEVINNGKISIFMSELINGEWNKPVELDLGVGVALSPSLTADEKTIYFEVGFMDKSNPRTLFDNNIDIYYSQKQPDDSWGIAKPID